MHLEALAWAPGTHGTFPGVSPSLMSYGRLLPVAVATALGPFLSWLGQVQGPSLLP